MIATHQRTPLRHLPDVRQERRNGILTVLVILMALAAGWLFKEYVLSYSHSVSLDPQLPTLVFPANWVVSETESLAFQATNPHSSDLFDSRIEVRIEDVASDDHLSLLAANWAFRQTEMLIAYRSLGSESILGPLGQPAVLNSYAYVTKPDPNIPRELNLPVVVRARDMLLVSNNDVTDQLLIITTAADIDLWDAESAAFQQIFASLGVELP